MRWLGPLTFLALLAGACSATGKVVPPTCTPECGAGSTCVFKIGSCSAAGECVPRPDGGQAECGALELACGCGTNVVTGCGFPDGYASGPTTGQRSCHE